MNERFSFDVANRLEKFAIRFSFDTANVRRHQTDLSIIETTFNHGTIVHAPTQIIDLHLFDVELFWTKFENEFAKILESFAVRGANFSAKSVRFDSTVDRRTIRRKSLRNVEQKIVEFIGEVSSNFWRRKIFFDFRTKFPVGKIDRPFGDERKFVDRTSSPIKNCSRTVKSATIKFRDSVFDATKFSIEKKRTETAERRFAPRRRFSLLRPIDARRKSIQTKTWRNFAARQHFQPIEFTTMTIDRTSKQNFREKFQRTNRREIRAFGHFRRIQT